MKLGLYLLFLGLGIACLVAGLFVTRQTWRTDIEPFGSRGRLFQIALRPERFAAPWPESMSMPACKAEHEPRCAA